MKQPEYNEIDSLLRSWAGRGRSVSAGAAENRAGAHLDADELSSYAEGALPPATRARYTTHLVDCDDCRKVVAQLAVAAGPVMKESPVEITPEIAGWRKALAAFFSGAVLKFALPALAITVVGLAFFAMQSGSNKTARVAEDKQQANSAPASSPDASGYVAYDSAPRTEAGTKEPQTAQPKPSAGKAGEKEQAAADAPTGAFGSLAKQPAEPKKENEAVTTADAEESKAGARPAATAEAPPPPKPAANAAPKDIAARGQATLADRDKKDRKRESQNTANDEVAGQPVSTVGEDDRQKTKALEARSAGRRDEADESRRVAGHRFERQDGVWKDSSYKSSMAIMNVARGSEQYRVLVADEPEIATIANQLKGEIILVWKSRAYRIK
jgi:Putative zinc-finger